MGEQQNLTEENVEELRAQLDKMKEDNPELRYRFYPQKGKPASATNDQLMEKIEDLERLIKITFDGHVLIDGRFQKITP